MSYIVAIIFFLMGYFRYYVSFSIIFFIHELGHVLAGVYFKWKIDKIIILPFGCLTVFNVHLNSPMREEFIISIMGIIFQLVFCMKIGFFYNFIIIIFNLLPIYPLDGSKILNLFFNKINNYKTSYILTIYISYFVVFGLIIYGIIKKDLISLIILMPLFLGVIKYNRNFNNTINKFYLERYLYKFNFKKVRIINNISQIKRDYTHVIKSNNLYIREEEFLKNMFDK